MVTKMKTPNAERSRLMAMARKARAPYPYVVASTNPEIGCVGIPAGVMKAGDRVVHYTNARVLVVVKIERSRVDWPGFDGVYECADVVAEDGGMIAGYGPRPVPVARFSARHLCFAK